MGNLWPFGLLDFVKESHLISGVHVVVNMLSFSVIVTLWSEVISFGGIRAAARRLAKIMVNEYVVKEAILGFSI